MHEDQTLAEVQSEWHGSYRSYAIGFFVSLFLTIVSFLLVIWHPLARHHIIYIVVSLALVQAIFQLRYFLHVGKEPAPRWETRMFYTMVFFLVLVVLGTLWIMYDLDQRTMMDMRT